VRFFEVTEYVPARNHVASLADDGGHLSDAAAEESGHYHDDNATRHTGPGSQWILHSRHSPSPHREDYIYTVSLRHGGSVFTDVRSESLREDDAPARREYRDVESYGYTTHETSEGNFREFVMRATFDHRHCYMTVCTGWISYDRRTTCYAAQHMLGSYRECHIH